VLYCPPEQSLDLRSAEAIWGYDVYSAALVWLAVALPALAASEEALFAFRVGLRDHRHDPQQWLAAATAATAAGATTNALPEGWSATFGQPQQPQQQQQHQQHQQHQQSSQQQEQLSRLSQSSQSSQSSSPQQQSSQQQGLLAWELLSAMLAYDPAHRPSAAEALTLPYLGDATCSLSTNGNGNSGNSGGEGPPLAPAAQPWSSLEALKNHNRPVVEGPRLSPDACELPDESSDWFWES
jgi:serine/threonine protein kinase